MSEVKKEYKQAQMWKETHELLGHLVDHYNEQQNREFGTKAKKVSRASVLDQLVRMKHYEIRKGN